MWKIITLIVIHFLSVHSKNASITLSFVTEDCTQIETFNPYIDLINWTIDRVNKLNLTRLPLEFTTYSICTEFDYFDIVYDIFRQEKTTNLGIIFNSQITINVEEFVNVLKIKYVSLKNRYWWHMENLIKATVKTLQSLKVNNNITLIYDKWIKADFFYKLSKQFSICISNAIPLDKYKPTNISSKDTFVVIKEDVQIITKGNEETYIIQTINEEEGLNETIFSPILFDIAAPVLSFIFNTPFSERQIIERLQIEEFTDHFTYATYLKKPNETLRKFQTFGIFESINQNIQGDCLDKECMEKCVNFQLPQIYSYIPEVHLRNEKWIFAIFTLSSLGVIFCIAIAVFFAVSFCKKDILQGNPTLTLLLLFSVIVMYSAVIPFCLLSPDKNLQNIICLSKGLMSTLCYALCFSILLSRSILLATASKEVGFMSHIPGPVQGFLTIFIFAVQGALSLQFTGYCNDIFHGNSFLYLMSYNAILLILLICICPLNAHSLRNYKEGKYFTICVILMGLVWLLWIIGYIFCEEKWKDPIICLGLVSNASVILGSIFIPRTYIMVIAIERDKITNALPSLHASSSIIDVYRASTQPVYDCINIAAVNAASIATNFLPPPPIQKDIGQENYEDESDFDRCDTPTALASPVSDKVTRF